MAQRILVTGGAGYVGSHACKALARAGFEPVVFDNLATGWAGAVKWGPLVRGDLMDRAAIDAALAEHRPVAVMHFAALSLVGDSMKDPGLYWRVNIGGALNLLEACAAAGVGNFVFSSTCATYGDQDGILLTEDTPQRPINAYGGSKLAIEQMLRDFGASSGISHVIFRYFNVAGADPQARIGLATVGATHLLKIAVEAATGQRAKIDVFGTDYPTADGSCIRDFIHVTDLAQAHVAEIRFLEWLQIGREAARQRHQPGDPPGGVPEGRDQRQFVRRVFFRHVQGDRRSHGISHQQMTFTFRPKFAQFLTGCFDPILAPAQVQVGDVRPEAGQERGAHLPAHLE